MGRPVFFKVDKDVNRNCSRLKKSAKMGKLNVTGISAQNSGKKPSLVLLVKSEESVYRMAVLY